MSAARTLAKADVRGVDVAPLSTVDVEYLDRLAALVRVSRERAESARGAFHAMATGALAASPALLAEALDELERTTSNFAADAKAFFDVWERTRGRR